MVFAYTGLLFVVLVGCAALGWSVRGRLHEHSFQHDAVESVRLLMGMLLTVSALVLGLLTSDAKQRFDQYNSELGALGAELIELQSRLLMYGPDAAPVRVLLRRYTAAAIADSWPEEPAPAGEFPRFDHNAPTSNVEGRQLGDMLTAVDQAIERLEPQDAFHAQIAGRLRDRVAGVVQQRWRIIFLVRPTISWPFLLVLNAWLAIIFAIFGLTSPRTRMVQVAVVLAAMSVTSAVFLIADYSDATSGLLKLSSAPLRLALAHMDIGV